MVAMDFRQSWLRLSQSRRNDGCLCQSDPPSSRKLRRTSFHRRVGRDGGPLGRTLRTPVSPRIRRVSPTVPRTNSRGTGREDSSRNRRDGFRSCPRGWLLRSRVFQPKLSEDHAAFAKSISRSLGHDHFPSRRVATSAFDDATAWLLIRKAGHSPSPSTCNTTALAIHSLLWTVTFMTVHSESISSPCGSTICPTKFPICLAKRREEKIDVVG